MRFPVEWAIGPWTVPAHLVFESLGYLVGSRLFFALRRRTADFLGAEQRWTLIAAAAVGALIGSKALVWIQHAGSWGAMAAHPESFAGGKTIVGGLLGGTLAVEWVKRALGVTRRTGDLFVLPLCAGIAIGRVGCFLAGLTDHTYGLPTALPWGVDFGDGVARHPAQLYEVAALAAIALWARRAMRSAALREGDVYRGFLTLYFVFRILLEWLKPNPVLVPGLSGIQIACLAGLFYSARDARRVFGWKESAA
jgi:prolipoprotein diacylglyceryltransferase